MRLERTNRTARNPLSKPLDTLTDIGPHIINVWIVSNSTTYHIARFIEQPDLVVLNVLAHFNLLPTQVAELQLRKTIAA